MINVFIILNEKSIDIEGSLYGEEISFKVFDNDVIELAKICTLNCFVGEKYFLVTHLIGSNTRLYIVKHGSNRYLISNHLKIMEDIGCLVDLDSIELSLFMGYFNPLNLPYKGVVSLVRGVSCKIDFFASTECFKVNIYKDLTRYIGCFYESDDWISMLVPSHADIDTHLVEIESIINNKLNEIKSQGVVKPGVFLSGGVDSAFIASQMTKCWDRGDISGFHLRSDFFGLNESEYTEKIARQFGISLQIINFDYKNLIDCLRDLQTFDLISYDLGFLGGIFLSKAASECDGVITGDGVGGSLRATKWYMDASKFYCSPSYKLFLLISSFLKCKKKTNKKNSKIDFFRKYINPSKYFYEKYRTFGNENIKTNNLICSPFWDFFERFAFLNEESIALFDYFIRDNYFVLEKYVQLETLGVNRYFFPYTDHYLFHKYRQLASINKRDAIIYNKKALRTLYAVNCSGAKLMGRKVALAINPLLLIDILIQSNRVDQQDIDQHLSCKFQERFSLNNLITGNAVGIDRRKLLYIYNTIMLYLWKKKWFYKIANSASTK